MNQESFAPIKVNSRLNKAVFFDRDGTIIQHVDLMHSVQDLRLLPGVSSAIRELNRNGFLVIVITNQPVVARGMVDEKEIDAIHAALINRLKKKGARIDVVHFCPHHPKANLKKYRVRCRCRKPAPGMILRASKQLKIDIKKSFMVGDALIDIVAGKKSGLKTILVKTGPGHARLDKKYKNIKPDFEVKDLRQAVQIIER